MREEKDNFRGQTDILPEFFFGARRLRRNERVMACERIKSLEVSTKMSFLSPSVFAFETKRDRVLASSSYHAGGVDQISSYEMHVGLPFVVVLHNIGKLDSSR